MERIGDTIKRLGYHAGLQERYRKMKEKILQDPYVRSFLNKEGNTLTDEAVEKGLVSLFEYSQQTRNCERCQSLEECKNLMKGYLPEVGVRGGFIHIHYSPCEKKRVYDEKRKQESLIKSLHVPKEIVNASFSDLDTVGDRVEAIKLAHEFVENYHPGRVQKGLYLYGKFGVGKSFLLGAIANELAKKGVSTMIVYYPELLRELKSSIGDSTLNEKIEMIKKQPVLMIDDIGAETMSSWTRDEVLGPILQFRMQEHLPTFFSSNFSYEELEHHLTYSQRGEAEKVKARRILERIKYLTRPVLMTGPNRRTGNF